MPIIIGRHAAYQVTVSGRGARGSLGAQKLLSELTTASLEHGDSRSIVAQLDRLLVGPGLQLRSSDALVASRRRVIDAITSGRLTVTVVTSRGRDVGGGSATAADRPTSAEPAPSAPADLGPADDDFIEVCLVDEAGEPVAGEPVEITLPDGGTWRGRTGRDGIARVVGIPSGTCRVSFTGLDSAAWEPHSG